ncbi:hypothetical protein VLK31_05080 [Variovorax sp. H27-G14]
MQSPGEVQRSLQPVIELRHEATGYGYSVRAPRSKGVIPPCSYHAGGFETLADGLSDVAQALGGDFSRIYVRLDGYCVGERDVNELRHAPHDVAVALQAACDAKRLLPQQPSSIPLELQDELTAE